MRIEDKIRNRMEELLERYPEGDFERTLGLIVSSR